MSILNSYLVTSQLLRPFDPLIHEKYVINTQIIVSPLPHQTVRGTYIFVARLCWRPFELGAEFSRWRCGRVVVYFQFVSYLC